MHKQEAQYMIRQYKFKKDPLKEMQQQMKKRNVLEKLTGQINK
jgi:hypothetical protein